MKTLTLILLAAALSSPSAVAGPNAPLPRDLPAYAPDRPLPVPEIAQKTLANGMTVLVVPRNGLPRVDYVLAVRNSGYGADAPAAAGFAAMLADLLTDGTPRHDSKGLAETADSYGGAIGAAAGNDGLTLYANALRSRAEPMIALLAEVARQASFPEAEVQLAKANALQVLRASEAQPGFRATRALLDAIYGDHPYSRIQYTEASIRAIEAATLRAEHARRFRPDRALLIVTGRVSAEEGFRWAEAAFGDWQNQGAAAPESAAIAVIFTRSASARACAIWVASSSATRCTASASCFFASACAISAALDALVCSSSRCLSEMVRSASSWASLARRDCCAETMSALAWASAADWRRLASATSDCTTLMLSELKISPRSVSSREQARRMITASGSSSSSAACTASAVEAALTSAVPAAGSTLAGAVLAEKSWSWVSRLMARRPELDSRSVMVFSWSDSGLAKYRLAAVLIIVSVSPTDTMALASTRILIGRGVPFSSMSAVWSVMSRSTLITLLEIVVPVVNNGSSLDLPGPR